MANESITVQAYSPFITGQIVRFDDGTTELDFGDVNIVRTKNDAYVTPEGGDDLFQIAFDSYKDVIDDAGKYYWLIATANDIDNPLDPEEFTGRELIVPYMIDFKLNNK